MSYYHESKNGLVFFEHFDDGSVSINSFFIEEINHVYTIIELCMFKKGWTHSTWLTLESISDADFKILITLYDNLND